MKHQNISAIAKAKGVNPATAYSRLAKGWSAEAATSTPARKYSKSYKHGEKAAAVWAYVIANPLARPCEVAKATNISYGYVFKLMSKTATPRSVFVAEAANKASNATLKLKVWHVCVSSACVAVVAAWLAVAMMS